MMVVAEYGHAIGGPNVKGSAMPAVSIDTVARRQPRGPRGARPRRRDRRRTPEHLPEAGSRPAPRSSRCASRARRTRPRSGGSRSPTRTTRPSSAPSTSWSQPHLRPGRAPRAGGRRELVAEHDADARDGEPADPTAAPHGSRPREDAPRRAGPVSHRGHDQRARAAVDLCRVGRVDEGQRLGRPSGRTPLPATTCERGIDMAIDQEAMVDPRVLAKLVTQYEVEQFYYEEAALLDAHRYAEWVRPLHRRHRTTSCPIRAHSLERASWTRSSRSRARWPTSTTTRCCSNGRRLEVRIGHVVGRGPAFAHAAHGATTCASSTNRGEELDSPVQLPHLPHPVEVGRRRVGRQPSRRAAPRRRVVQDREDASSCSSRRCCSPATCSLLLGSAWRPQTSVHSGRSARPSATTRWM